MKKLILIITISTVFTALAFGDDTRPQIPDTWSKQLKAGAEKMVIEGIAPNDAITMTGSMIQAQFDQETILSIQNLVIDFHGKGLPVEAVINKAYEGLAKQIQPPLILGAMEHVAIRYEFAFKQARQLAHQEAEWRHLGHIIAMGLAAGLEHQDTDKIVKQLQAKMNQLKTTDRNTLVSQTLLTARDMARQGISSGTTAEVVNQALEHGFNVQQMKSMNHAFMSHTPRSSIEHRAKNISKAIQQGKNPQNTINMGKSGHKGASGGKSNRGGAGSGPDSGGGSGSGGSGGAGSGGGTGGGSGGSGGGSGGSGGGSGGAGGGSGGGGGPGGGPGGGS